MCFDLHVCVSSKGCLIIPAYFIVADRTGTSENGVTAALTAARKAALT